MTTSFRARSFPRSPVSPGLLLASAVLLWLGSVTGCARSEAPPPPVEAKVEGHWLQPLAHGSRMVPCGHGHHAWVWSPNRAGFWLVDAEGRESVIEGLGDKDVWVVDVVPTAEPERAWVFVQVPSPYKPSTVLYLVDHRRRLEVPEVSVQEMSLVPSEGRERLWVVSQFNLQQPLLVDAEGNVEPVRLSSSGPGWLSAREVLPVAAGRQAWMVLDQSLFHVDPRAGGQPNSKPLPVRDVRELLPTRQPQRAWVLAELPGRSEPQFFLASREGVKTTATPLPGGVWRLFAHRDANLVWTLRSASASGEPRPVLELALVGLDGKTVGPGVTLEGVPAVERSPDGHLWVVDERRVYLLGEGGEEVARSADAEGLGGAELFPLSAERAWVVTEDGGVRLLSVKGRTLTSGDQSVTGLHEPRLMALDAHGGWALSDGGTRLHRLSLGPGGLQVTQVLEGAGLNDVFPIPGTGRAWVTGIPRGSLYGPASEVGRVRVGFAGGARIERDAKGKVQVEGRLEAGAPLESLELDWPGLAQAAGAGRTLRLELRAEDGKGALVGQGVRRLAEPAGVLFQWMEPPGSAEHLYRTVVAHEVENGTRLTATFQHVPFGVPLLDRVWVRTALACLAVTLLLLLPMLLLRPSAAPRRWLPLAGYVVTGVGAGGGELLGLLGGLRIHLPTVLAVTCAELVLCAGLGLLSPAVFRRLVFTHPFSWAAAPLLRWPAFRRRFFATHVRQVRRRVDVASAQANGEVFVELSSHVTEYAGPGVAPSSSERTAEELCGLLTRERAHLLIQCAGGRGKSALLRRLVRLSLEHFEKQPSSPLPVFIDPAAEDLETAAKEALQDLGLPEELRDVLLESGDFFLVLDGLTESKLEPEALRRYLEREMGLHAPVLLSARPNEAYRTAMAHALRWMAVEPKRLDAAGLERFQAAYPGADGKPVPLSESLLRICRGRAADGSYVPILVRLALRFGGGGVDSVINLYRAVFAGLLKKAPDDAETSEMLGFAEALCLGSYWRHRSRLIVFRDSPDEAKLRVLLDAGLLVAADARPGAVPTHVRFFHDSMQSYLTARALYAQHAAQERWDCLWRAAGEPGFAREQSDLMTEAGSELFQMCSYVFGYDARLKAELLRHLEQCAEANDERLNKEGILAAVPEELRPTLRKSVRVLSPGLLLSEAGRVCGEHTDGEALFLLYARIAPLAWPWKPEEASPARSQEDANAA
ncbi:hypothetical protein ATI61_109304 [Archangium gephyra]|uniref:NACHT domain-containing protein n=1 Tax=Archangium gephyra TaxID=48 RepID=A0ABX9JW41_9BACT|nr:hypothetical protein [Archangium gephyra]REG27962.1 hypothetical protein ATI61_109304 [Archangium gephyra]